MTCEEFLRLMDEDRLEADPSAAAHLESCAACRAAHSRWRVVQDEFRAMRDEPAPPFLHTRVMAHVRSEGAERRTFGSWLFQLRPSWATTLLGLLIGIVLGGFGVWHWKAPDEIRGKEVRPMNLSQRPVGDMKDKKHSAPEMPEPKAEKSRALPALSELPTHQAPRSDHPAPRRQEEGSASDSAAPGSSDYNKAASGPALQPSAEGFAGQTDERSFGAPGAPSAGAAASKEEQGPAAPGPADREFDYASPASTPTEVVCTLKPVGQGPLRAVQLPPEAAPPAGGEWRVDLSQDGTLRVVDAQGRRISGSLDILAASLSGLHLQPGQYLLRRIS